jgi:molecular chaperone DnaJ
VSESDTISVKVPAGVANGNYIPLRGMGDVGPRGGGAGDLIVLIEEKPHEVFEREGADLHLELPVSFVTLALGGKAEVPTLGGAVAALEVPVGSPAERVLRMKGKGLPSLRGGHGDLLVRLRVVVPGKLSSADKKLLEELGRSENFRAPKPSRSLFSRVKDAFTG